MATVADLAASRPLTFLVNNAGVAHYMPLPELAQEPLSDGAISGADGRGASTRYWRCPLRA
ncbi:hypothetical protein OM076_37500 [Solirubrobacter ginsenosidimutans]|uniref:Uncharacterized protein n=1 Tax=Solirubrobacter ginsenosidimutans TaxID=490573 RepID=A0A9X3S7G2_9ACTN|nr:hypothetical protein [Solirubrobacter ginsenosidimutans]MDA0166021.1 hypothetical protein [Solirubrobacter ginsenosidimutans]